jgi:pimeloyl-ACP methyl ester carboxylesterase
MKRLRGLELEHVLGAPTLVFLHEGLGSARQWRDFPRKLAAATGCGLLVYSRRGYGGSDPVPLPRPLTYMHEEGERELPALLGDTSITDAILFGHSDGASIALVAAGSGRAPSVRGLILEAPHVFCEELSVRSIAAARDAYERGDLRDKLRRWHGDNVDVAFWGWNRAWLDPGFAAWSIESYLPCVGVPVLQLQGRDDPYGTEAQLRSIERGASGPVTTLLLDHCGHAPHKDQPAAVLKAATDFILAIKDS